MDVTPTGAGLGAFVSDVDLREPLSAEDGAQLLTQLGEYGVLLFRDQHITPAQHIAFAEAVGTINVNRYFAENPEYPQIAQVRTAPTNKTRIGQVWHTDHSYDEEPALGSILVARELPPHGGDTAWSNMYTAYDTLSPGLKETLSGMRAVHSSNEAFGTRLGQLPSEEVEGRFREHIPKPDVTHPVVITHPVSGRKALYVNATFTQRFDGWTARESEPLLRYLYDHASQIDFTYRFRWEPGSIAMWDNRCTWHCALGGYEGHGRIMDRITLDGCAISA